MGAHKSRSWRWVVGTLLLFVPIALVPAAQADLLDPPLQLTLDNHFPDLGDPMTFSVTGPPGTEFTVRGSREPSETFLPNWGRVFIGLDNLLTVGSGVLDGNGEGSVTINVPDNSNLLDQVFYFQVRGELDPDQGVSNAVAARMQSTAPSGPRQPSGMAVTSDGTKVYVAHERDATLSVIDVATDTLIADFPIGPVTTTIGKPIAVAVDPEDRHVYIVDPRRREMTIVHVPSDSVAGQIPVPGGSNGIAFDFSGAQKLVYVTNTRDRAVLVFEEVSAGSYVSLPSIPVEGHGPGPIRLLADGTLAVGNRQSLDVEFLDPDAAAGSQTLARVSLTGMPFALLERDDELLVPTFTPETVPDSGDGNNDVVEIDLTTRTLTSTVHWQDVGTDYLSGDVSSQSVVVAGSGSGTVLVADRATLTLDETIDLAPGEPTAHPVQVLLLPDLGSGERAYALNHFRETVRPIDLSAGPPFLLGAEIAMAHSGLPRVALVDLSDEENGDWFFSTVEFFNGTATNPNRVTCNTCHTWFFSSGFISADIENAQVLFELGDTGPWLHAGNVTDLRNKTVNLFGAHGTVGGQLSFDAEFAMTVFQRDGIGGTASPFLEDDGTLSPQAEAGKLLFEGVAQCSTCHMEPLFIPVDEADRTLESGVGTGLVPANVTTLLGLWASGPYLHDGSAETLLDVLESNTGDLHGTTSTLTPSELDDLVAYLQSL